MGDFLFLITGQGVMVPGVLGFVQFSCNALGEPLRTGADARDVTTYFAHTEEGLASKAVDAGKKGFPLVRFALE